MLNEKYRITAQDLLSADVQIVPATVPRDVGLDRDHRRLRPGRSRRGYISLRAIADVKTPRYRQWRMR